MKKIILVLVFIICEASAFGVIALDVDISGSLDFGYIVVADISNNMSTIPAEDGGIKISFLSFEPGDTVSIVLSGADVIGNQLILDNGNVIVDFMSSTGKWNGIPTDRPFYIGGEIKAKYSSAGDIPINSGITVTVTSEIII